MDLKTYSMCLIKSKLLFLKKSLKLLLSKAYIATVNSFVMLIISLKLVFLITYNFIELAHYLCVSFYMFLLSYYKIFVDVQWVMIVIWKYLLVIRQNIYVCLMLIYLINHDGIACYI